jgi:hypothetical protein
MLKEVGASGQISLGKKYAGQLFDVVFCPDGRVELVPMKAVPANQLQEEAGSYRVGDGWLTPERLAARKAARARPPEEVEAARIQWEADNQEAIAAMNERMSKIGSMGRRVHEWRQARGAQAEPGPVPSNGPD